MIKTKYLLLCLAVFFSAAVCRAEDQDKTANSSASFSASSSSSSSSSSSDSSHDSSQQAQLRKWFVEAPAILPQADMPLKGLPLWHTNAPLTSDQIQEMFEKGQANGFGGFTFLPLSKTTPKYLSDEYFKYFGEVLDTAKARGMKIIFYDDVDFPSGSAGGQLKEKFPDSILKRLDKYEWDVTGPLEFEEKSPVPLAQKTLYGKPEGVLQAAVAMNVKTFERIEITDCVKDGELKWSVPDGDWKIMIFVCVTDNHALVDYMNPQAVKNFISLTYDQFYKRFPQHFGTTIPIVFYDDITNTQTSGSRNWTLEFNDKYEQMFGHPLGKDYPAAFYNVGPETQTLRYQIWSVRNALFSEGYPRVVNEWCQEHGLKSSGHPQGPYVIQPCDMCGDAMLMHYYSSATLFDSIHYYGHGRNGFKIPTSAAFNFDQPLCLVEIYGNYRNKYFDENMLYRSAMEIFARGGNMLLPHGIWSDPATMYIPPDISWRNEALNNGLPKYSEFVSRCSLLLQGGRHVADIGMVYPVDNLKAFFHFIKEWPKGDYPYGTYVPQETDYLAVGDDLTTRIYRDFTILHPMTIDQKCKVLQINGKTSFRMLNNTNWEQYEVVLLTGSEVISWSNMRKILAFYQAGGKVLATTRLPSRSSEGDCDAQVCNAIQTIFGVDPRTQAPVKAAKTGQEDIVLPATFQKIRELNDFAQFHAPTNGLVEYKTPVKNARAVFLPNPTTDLLKKALDSLIENPDVAILQNPDEPIPTLEIVPRWETPTVGMFQYIHKVKDGLDVFFLANSSDSGIEFDIQMRGVFQTLELWDPHTGEISSISPDRIIRDNGRTVVRHVKLGAVKSAFIVAK